MSFCFQSSFEHLMAELQRIELKVKLQVSRLRHTENQNGKENYNGFYLSDYDIDKILGTSYFSQTSNTSLQSDETSLSLLESLKKLENNIVDKKRESLKQGLFLRTHKLEKLFKLSAFDIDVLLICLMPELDLRYQKVYAYLQNDASKKNPTVDLILNLLCESFEDRYIARESFYHENLLYKYHLIKLYDTHNQRIDSLLNRSLQIDERIVSYLLGIDCIDDKLLSFVNIQKSDCRLKDIILPEETRHNLEEISRQYKEKEFIFYFHGNSGVGKKSTAEAICNELGLLLLNIDINNMIVTNNSLETSVPLFVREGLLQNAALYIDNFSSLNTVDRDGKQAYDITLRELANYPGWIFISGEKEWQLPKVLHHKLFVDIEFPLPSYQLRKQLWEKQWNGNGLLNGDIDFNGLAGRFRLSGGQIGDAIAMAKNIAMWRDADNDKVTIQDLYLASRKQSRQRISSLAYQIHPKYEWGDIVLPEDQMEQLHEICGHVKHHYTVYSDWGFGQKLSRGNGINVLFAGPSGTGKTMAADIMANELGIDLYKIDLSAIVSKYIGETEKNLDRIFEEGKTANAILFFDEADALFGKRSEVRDSHDRYANIEIAYLLQKMEEYDGLVILATNLKKNMDEAFARRMHFSIEFPMPEEDDRYRIWESVFPKKAPLDDDIDLNFMAKQFKITGGNIKNIALSAAFLAAQDGCFITMENLIKGTKREYQKMGKLCTETDFARYFDLVKG